MPIAEFAYNNSVHAALRISPFYVAYRWNLEIHAGPQAARDELQEREVLAAKAQAKRMREAHEALARRWREASA